MKVVMRFAEVFVMTALFVSLFIGASSFGISTILGEEEVDAYEITVVGVYEMHVVGSPELRFHMAIWPSGIFGVTQPVEGRTYAMGHYLFAESEREEDTGSELVMLSDHNHLSGSNTIAIERHESSIYIDGNGNVTGEINAVVYDLNFVEQSRMMVDVVGRRLPDPAN